MKRILLSVCATMVLLSGCASSDIFDDIGTNMASPLGMAVDSTARRLYLSNSNANVFYDYSQGNFQVLDITAPAAPVLINTAQTPSFGGLLYFDPTSQRVFMPSRYQNAPVVTQGQLLSIDVDETAGTFLQYTTTTTQPNPFAFVCCSSTNQFFMSSTAGVLQFGDITANPPVLTNVSLQQRLSTNTTLNTFTPNDMVMLGNQLFITRNGGGLLVVNLDEVGDASLNPVDYYVSNMHSPRGIATDGTYLYIVNPDTIGGQSKNWLVIVDPTLLPPLTDNTETQVFDETTAGFIVGNIQVGNNPQMVAVAGGIAYVTNQNDNTVSVIDLASKTVTATITVGTQPFNLVMDAPGGTPTTLYVANLISNTLSIIDVATNSVVGTYP